jgi:hypothetical protein
VWHDDEYDLAERQNSHPATIQRLVLTLILLSFCVAVVIIVADNLNTQFGIDSAPFVGLICIAIGLIAAAFEWAVKDATGRGFPTCRKLSLGLVGFGVLLVVVELRHYRWSSRGPSVVSVARWNMKTLEKAVLAYERQFGVRPSALDQLLQPPSGKAFVEPEALKTPWGQPYEYDPSGPRNQGIQPDIWAVLPNGETIGNWPSR